MFYVLLYVTLCPFEFCNHLDGKRELVALLSLSSWCLVIVVWLFLAVPCVCLQFVIVVFPDHTHYFLPSLFKLHVYPWGPKWGGGGHMHHIGLYREYKKNILI